MDINEKVDAVEEQDDQKIKRKKRKEIDEENRSFGIGLDVGTCFCVCAKSINNEASFKVQRDAFFDVENTIMSKNMLNKLNAHYIESEDKRNLYVVGEEALQLANFFNKEVRRPLSHGCISTREKEALTMIKIILHALVGNPKKQNEVCYFSVPARPIDEDSYNIIYHENILKSFITSFGYNAIPINEALAIIWSDLEDCDFTGMSLSFGAGMVNFCLAFLGVSEKDNQFSITRSGDWIDTNSATAVGLKASRITSIKEAGIDLLNPKTREETAIKIYYENLIKYTCSSLEKHLNQSNNLPNFDKPITVIVSGGTSKPIGFEKIFEAELLSRSLPFQIKEVRKAKDQLNSVAKGCLLSALNHE